MQITDKRLTYFDIQQQIEQTLSAVITDELQRRTELNWFIETTLGISPHTLKLSPESIFNNSDKLKLLEKQLQQRVNTRFPIQYILGQAWFYGLKFNVTPAVLIPRPETELLVEAAITEIKENNYQHVLDLATGSGCIAISIQKQCPNTTMIASDISPAALAIAKENAQKNQVELTLIESNWFQNLKHCKARYE